MTTKELKLEAAIDRLYDKLAKLEAERKARRDAFEKGSVAEPLRRLVRHGIGPNGLPDARPKKKNRSE